MPAALPMGVKLVPLEQEVWWASQLLWTFWRIKKSLESKQN
jgi:hypothetical protein